MTKKTINWDDLPSVIEDTTKYSKALEKQKDLDFQIKDMENTIAKLRASRGVDAPIPDNIDLFGTLSVILIHLDTSWLREPTTYEAHIVGVDKDYVHIKISNDGRNVFKSVPLQSLKEKGYYYFKDEGAFVCDKVTSYEGFKEIMDASFNAEKHQIQNEIAWHKKQLEKAQQEITRLEGELKSFDDISISKVQKKMREVNFATGWDFGVDTTEFLDNLPRVYKI